MDRVAHVRFDGAWAGTLWQDAEGFHFLYADSYLAQGVPIGWLFPLGREVFHSPGLFPLFENLASEGWLRDLQSREQKIDPSDRFALLLANGADLTGAITVERAP